MSPTKTLTTSPLSRSHAWALALIATLTMAVSYVDRQVLSAVGSHVTKEFHLSETNYGFLVSAFSLAYLVGSPLAGLLIDHVGARRGLVGAVLVWSVVAAAHALVPSFGVLIAMRIALGLAESPSFPGAAQTVQRALPPAERARGFGVLFTGSSFGAMLAPLIADPFTSRWGFRSAFIGTAIVGLIWVPVWLAFTSNKRAKAVLDDGIGAPKEGAPARPGFFATLSNPAAMRAMLAILAVSPGLGFMFNWAQKYLDAAHHIGLTQAKPYLVMVPLFFDVGSIAFGHASSVRARAGKLGGGPDRLVFGIATLLALALAAVPFMRTPLHAMIAAGFGVAGGGGVFALLTADMLARVPRSMVSAAAGLGAAAQSVGYIVASPVLGRIIDVGGYTPAFVVLAAWVIPGCVAWLVWSPPPPVEEALAPADLSRPA